MNILVIAAAISSLAFAGPAPAPAVTAAPAPAPAAVVPANDGIDVQVAQESYQGVTVPLSAEVLALHNNATVPWGVMKRYSATTIATSLVRRLHNAYEQQANDAKPAYDYLKNTMIQLKFKDEVLPLIIAHGFLNQHQTGSSGGLVDGDRRSQIETSLIHESLEDTYSAGRTKQNEIRPKYAFLTFPKDSNGQQRGHFSRQYGNMVAVMKDEVKMRSTFTAVDSVDGNMDASGNVAIGQVRAHTFFFRSTHVLAKIPDPTRNDGTDTEEDYWEAQIWGPVTVQQDVAYFLVNCPGDTEVSAATHELIKKTGLPAYKCEFVTDHSHFEKGARVD